MEDKCNSDGGCGVVRLDWWIVSSASGVICSGVDLPEGPLCWTCLVAFFMHWQCGILCSYRFAASCTRAGRAAVLGVHQH